MPHSIPETSSTMSDEPTSSSSSSANVFPKPVGATLLVPDSYGGPTSPRSIFSFEESIMSTPPTQLDGDSFAERKNITRTLDRGAPGEKKGGLEESSAGKSYGSRRRTQYYEEQFQYRATTGSARDRVYKDSPVIVELRTNVIIKDEYTLVTDLSYHLSSRYHRPESSIMINVNHSACLLLGGSFEPAYILSISALPSQLQPATNKRNAALIQTFMSEIISVPEDRGIIRFQAIPEESLAINGRTILGEIERLEKQETEENGGALKRALTKASGKSSKSASSKPNTSLQLSRKGSGANQGVAETPTPPIPSPGPFDTSFDSKVSPSAHSDQSYFTHFSRPKKSMPVLLPPPIPEDSRPPAITKRKSFFAVFKR